MRWLPILSVIVAASSALAQPSTPHEPATEPPEQSTPPAPLPKTYPYDSFARRPLTVPDRQLEFRMALGFANGQFSEFIEDDSLIGSFRIAYGLSDRVEYRFPLSFGWSFGDPTGISETDRVLEVGVAGGGFGCCAPGFVWHLDLFAGFSARKMMTDASALVGGVALHSYVGNLADGGYATMNFGLLTDLTDRLAIDLSATATLSLAFQPQATWSPAVRFADLSRPLLQFRATEWLDVVATAGLGLGRTGAEFHAGAGVWLHWR